MNPIQPPRGSVVVMFLLSAGLLFLGPEHARAQQTCNATPFFDVTSWTGTFTLSGVGSGTDASGASYGVNESIVATPDLTGVGPGSWTGTFNEKIHIDDILTNSDGSFDHITDDETLTQGVTSTRSKLAGAGLSINAANCTFEFDFDPSNNQVATDQNGISVVGGATGFIGGYQVGTFLVTPASIVAPLPTGGSTLTISATLSLSAFSQVGPEVTWTMNLSLSPKQDLDMLVTIPDYSTWRPTANHKETEVGLDLSGQKPNVLEIQALLVNKTTQQPVDFPPDSVTFSLVDSSNEPGVAMNWPPRASATNDPDMTFDLGQNPECTEGLETCTFADPVTVEIKPILSPIAAPVSIRLSPHDWGGWATLNVIANVAAQSIPGHMVTTNGTNDPNILLPQRQSPSHIADSWKAAHGAVGLADDDDSETNPVGDNQAGDGLTLYEEYRGIYTGCSKSSAPPQPEGTGGACQHVEGDPKTKDIFIVNRIGAQGIEGIGLFQFASGLNVHYHGLQLAEVGPQGDPSYRVINFNNLGLPLHKVDQHAIILDWGTKAEAGKASGTVPTADAPGGTCGYLPKHTDHIGIDQDLLQPAYQASTGSSYSELTVHVAHELSHSVDVCHHGDGIDHFEVWFVDPNTKEIMEQTLGGADNTTPVGTPSSITVVNEEQLLQPVIVGLTGFQLGLEDSNGNPLPGSNPYRVGNRLCNSSVVLNGESSGDVLDFMRYDDTIAFIPSKPPDVRVLASDFASGSGVDLTDHPIGTGVNDPGRKPLSRFGDADTAHQRGNDRSQVDVNDSHSEIPRGDFVCQ
jgi:hypothetical protein